MKVQANWVELALMPMGPSRKECDTEENRSKIIGDAVHYQQWDTAYSQAQKLLVFLEKWKLQNDARIAAKKAEKLAMRGAA